MFNADAMQTIIASLRLASPGAANGVRLFKSDRNRCICCFGILVVNKVLCVGTENFFFRIFCFLNVVHHVASPGEIISS